MGVSEMEGLVGLRRYICVERAAIGRKSGRGCFQNRRVFLTEKESPKKRPLSEEGFSTTGGYGPSEALELHRASSKRSQKAA